MFDQLVNKVGLDKFTHFFAGCSIASLISIVVILQDEAFDWDALLMSFISIPIVFIIAFFKEATDIKDTGFSWKDILATVLGCIPTLAAILIGIVFQHLNN